MFKILIFYILSNMHVINKYSEDIIDDLTNISKNKNYNAKKKLNLSFDSNSTSVVDNSDEDSKVNKWILNSSFDTNSSLIGSKYDEKFSEINPDQKLISKRDSNKKQFNQNSKNKITNFLYNPKKNGIEYFKSKISSLEKENNILKNLINSKFDKTNNFLNQNIYNRNILNNNINQFNNNITKRNNLNRSSIKNLNQTNNRKISNNYLNQSYNQFNNNITKRNNLNRNSNFYMNLNQKNNRKISNNYLNQSYNQFNNNITKRNNLNINSNYYMNLNQTNNRKISNNYLNQSYNNLNPTNRHSINYMNLNQTNNNRKKNLPNHLKFKIKKKLLPKKYIFKEFRNKTGGKIGKILLENLQFIFICRNSYLRKKNKKLKYYNFVSKLYNFKFFETAPNYEIKKKGKNNIKKYYIPSKYYIELKNKYKSRKELPRFSSYKITEANNQDGIDFFEKIFNK